MSAPRLRHGGELPRHALRDGIEQRRVRREQNRLRHFVVLGLRKKIHRYPIRVGAGVGDNEYLRGSGDHVDADSAENAPFGGRDIGIAGTDDLVDRGNRRRAVGERRHRLRSAYRKGPRYAGKMRRGKHKRVPRAAGGGYDHDDFRNAGNLGRNGVHEHRRRIRRLPSGNVQAHPLERAHLLPHPRAVGVAHFPARRRLAALMLVKFANPPAGCDEGIARVAVEGIECRCKLRSKNLQGRDAGRLDSIEQRRVFEHGCIAAHAYVGDDVGNRCVDGFILRGIARGQPRKRRGEIGRRRIEAAKLSHERFLSPPRRSNRAPAARFRA